MLKVQEFISCFDTLSEALIYLKRNLDIETVSSQLPDKLSPYGPLMVLKPGQRADMSDPLVREANCLVIDQNGEIISKAWDHPLIVNKIEELPVDFDFTRDVFCEEIPDGELVVVYNIDGDWVISTNDSAAGLKYIGETELPAFTFENEIKTMLSRRYSGGWDTPFRNVNPMMAFVFIYVNPHLGKIMPIISQELYLMGVINLDNYYEISTNTLDNMAEKMDFTRPTCTEVHGVNSLHSRLNQMRTLSPGLMLRNGRGQRVMIPNPIYKVVKNAVDARDRVRPTHIASIMQAVRDSSDITSISAAYTKFAPMLRLLWNGREKLWEELMSLWNSAHREKNLKDFAERVQHNPLNYLLFMYKDGRINNLIEEIEKLKPIKIVRLIRNQQQEEYESAAKYLKSVGGNADGSEEDSVEKEEKDAAETEESSIPWSQDGD